jgi:hypothetical protein
MPTTNTNTYFISETYLRENTPFNQNLDINDIVNNIDPASDMHIQPILGKNFYDSLLLSYSAQTLTANETTLVMHIKPALAYRAAELSLPFIQYQIKNKGPQTQSGDNSAAIDLTTLRYLTNELKNRAEFYEQRLINYLCDNSASFPAYTTNNSTDISPSTASPYDSGFALYGNLSDRDFFKKYGYYR